MPHIIYGGIKYTQVRHAVYCKKCRETVESRDVHDFKMCSCNSVGVDGGISDGNRIIGDDMESRAVYSAYIKGKHIFLPKSVIREFYGL